MNWPEHNVELLEPSGSEGDCQSWAFEYLGMPKYAHESLTREYLEQIGFERTREPHHGDLMVHGQSPNGGAYHYGIFHDGSSRTEYRIISKLGIKGPICIHPWEVYSEGSTIEFYRHPRKPDLF